jgi:hypothetical protein
MFIVAAGVVRRFCFLVNHKFYLRTLLFVQGKCQLKSLVERQ